MLEYIVITATAIGLPVIFVVHALSKARKRNGIVMSRLRTPTLSSKD